MFSRFIRSAIIIILSITTLFPGNPWVAAADSPQIQPGDTGSTLQGTSQGKLLEAADNRLLIKFSAPGFQVVNQMVNGIERARINVPGAVQTDQPGLPAVPVYSILVAIPPQSDYSLRIVSATVKAQALSTPLAFAESPSVQDPETGASIQRITTEHGADFQPGQLYPANPVRVASEAWLRDQRILRLEYYPAQVNQATLQWNWTPDVQVELLFSPPSSPVKMQFLPPVSAIERNHDSFEKVLQTSLLNYDQGANWRAAPQASIPGDFGFTQARDFSPAVQIVVDHDGIYKVTYEQLMAAGVNLAEDPHNFQLTSQGQPVAFLLQGNGDNHFDPGEAVIFYGQKFYGDHLASVYTSSMSQWSLLCPLTCKLSKQLEDYTNDNTYWLRMGTSPGLQINTVDAAPKDTATIPAYYTSTVHAEENHRWYATHLVDEGVWYWASTSTSVITSSFATNLTAVSPDVPTAIISGSLMGFSNNPGYNVQIKLNSYLPVLTSNSWDYIKRYTFRASAPVTAIVNNGANTLNVISAAPSSHIMFFDWFEVRYARLFQALNDVLQFNYPISGTVQFKAKGFTSGNAMVFDISNPLVPIQMSNPRITPDGGAGTNQVEFQDSQPGEHATYIIAGSAQIQTPKKIQNYLPPDLTPAQGGADYIFITHKNFYTSTVTLANYRKSQGLTTFVVNIDDVYQQFNYGIFHSVAIRNYLAYAMSSWTVKPRYVLLVGDGHFNFKNYTNPNIKNIATSDTIFTPPNLAFIDPWQGQTDATALLAMVVGNDPLPDIAIGRLPVNNQAQADAIVAKTIAYEQSSRQNWQKNTVYIADNPDTAGDFNASVNDLASRFTPLGWSTKKIFVSDYLSNLPGPTTRKVISQSVNITGTLFLTYVGHAGIPFWANESIMTTKLVTQTMLNKNKLPILLSLDCLDGFWHYPDPTNNSSLAETMVRIPNGGAVAAFSPTGLGLTNGHDTLANGFFTTFYKNDVWELAPAALNAKLAIFTSGSHMDLLYTYTILGDPALRIQGSLDKLIYLPLISH